MPDATYTFHTQASHSFVSHRWLRREPSGDVVLSAPHPTMSAARADASIHFMAHRPDEILRSIARLFGLTLAELTGPRRCRSIARPRLLAFWILRRTGLSLPRIGKLLNRDHTTVLAGIRSFERSLDACESWAVSARERWAVDVHDLRTLHPLENLDE